MDLRESKLLSIREEKRHPWELARLKVLLYCLDTYVKKTGTSRLKILDVGCGDIFVIEKLSKHYPEAEFWAVDTAFTEDVIGNFKTRVYSNRINFCRSLSEMSLPEGFDFDLILLLDVIEHIDNDSAFLLELSSSSFFSSNTNLVITAPAFRSLFSGLDTFLLHHRRYNNKQLQKVIGEAGLSNAHMSYFFFLLLLPRFLRVVFEKIFGKKKQNEEGIGNYKYGIVISKIIVFVLMSDFYFSRLLLNLGIKLPGLSNIVVCRKYVS